MVLLRLVWVKREERRVLAADGLSYRSRPQWLARCRPIDERGATTPWNQIRTLSREAIAVLCRKDSKLIAAPETAEETISIITGLGIEIGSFADRDLHSSRTWRKDPLYPSQLASAIKTGPPLIRGIKRPKLSHGYIPPITRLLTDCWNCILVARSSRRRTVSPRASSRGYHEARRR